MSGKNSHQDRIEAKLLFNGGMAELVDAADLKSAGHLTVGVRVPLPLPFFS